MLSTERDLIDFLEKSAILFQRVQHPPVYTCEQAEELRPSLPGVSTKNLFLRDKRKNFFLVMTACDKSLDLKELSRQIAAPKLHFGSETELANSLGVTPGAVTVLALVNDPNQFVTLLVDCEIWDSEFYLCHPMVNTATLSISKAGLLRFFNLTGHEPNVIDMPDRNL